MPDLLLQTVRLSLPPMTAEDLTALPRPDSPK
jgi:hypothetical protein